MNIFRTSISVRVGLVLVWGLTCLRALFRDQSESKPASRPRPNSFTPYPQGKEEENLRPVLKEGVKANVVSEPPPSPVQAATEREDVVSKPLSSPVGVVPDGHVGWARRRQERVKAIIGEETYGNLEALMRWCWGDKIEEVMAKMSLGRSGFYYRLEQALARLPEVFADGRQHNGRQAASMDSAVAGRIAEMVVGQPEITPAEVSQRLAQQDGTQVKAEEVADYLAQARLTDYGGSPYRKSVLPAIKEVDNRFSRYAASLLQVLALEQLGFYQAAPLLDVTGPKTYYSHLLRCHTVLLAMSSSKTRLYHTGELVKDELARVLGEAQYPERSDLHAYFDRIVEQDQVEVEQGLPEEKRLVGQFVRAAQQLMAGTAQAGAGRAIYVDPHVIALHTAKAIARTKHGIQERIVKALVKVRAVSAEQPGRMLSFLLGQGNLSFHACLEKAVDLTAWTTGESVELVGVDRGALSKGNPGMLREARHRSDGMVGG